MSDLNSLKHQLKHWFYYSAHPIFALSVSEHPKLLYLKNKK